jgi:hypothetical protein
MDRLARYRSGEELDVLLAEAAAAREKLAEEAETPEVQVEAEEIAEAAEAEVAETEIEAEEVVDGRGGGLTPIPYIRVLESRLSRKTPA